MAVSGYEDVVVPYHHAVEIVKNSTNPFSTAIIIPDSDHIFCVLDSNKSKAEYVINMTTEWIRKVLSVGI